MSIPEPYERLSKWPLEDELQQLMSKLHVVQGVLCTVDHVHMERKRDDQGVEWYEFRIVAKPFAPGPHG